MPAYFAACLGSGAKVGEQWGKVKNTTVGVVGEVGEVGEFYLLSYYYSIWHGLQCALCGCGLCALYSGQKDTEPPLRPPPPLRALNPG